MGNEQELRLVINGDAKGAEQALKGLQGTLRSTGDGFSKAGSMLTKGVTLPLVAIGGAAIKMSTDFNASMANVASLIPGNTARVLELKTGVQDMAIATGKSTDDLSKGLYQVISAFGDTADTATILEQNAKAAAAGVATTADAINLTSAVTKAYGTANAEGVKHASDLALMTVRLGQTTFPELAASIGRVTPLTKNLGVSQEELFATMATLTGVTGGAAEVSTQLRGAMQSLMAPTDAAAKAMKGAGYANGEALVKAKGMAGALQFLTDAASKSGQPLQEFISSIEGQTAAMALTGPQAKDYAAKLAEMGKAAGATDAAFNEQTNGVNKLGFTFAQLQQQLTVTMQRLGDGLAPALSTVLDLLQPVLKYVGDLSTRFSTASPAVQKVVVAIAAVAAAIGPLLSVVGSVLGAASAIAGAGGLGAIAAAAGPVGIALAAIAAVGYLVWQNFDKIKAVVAMVAVDVQGAFLKIADAWQSSGAAGGFAAIGAAFDNVKAVVMSTVAKVAPIVQDFAMDMRASFQYVVNWVVANMPLIQKTIATVINAVAVVWKTLEPIIVPVVKAVFGTASAIVGTVMKTVLGIIKAVMQLITGDWKGAWKTLVDTAKNLFSGIGKIVSQILSGVVGTIKGLGSSFAAAGRGLFQAFIDGVVEKFAAIKAKVLELVAWVRDHLPGSDAKMGPLSDLTASGKAFPVTIAKGMAAGIPALQNAAQRAAATMAGGVTAGSAAASSVSNTWNISGNRQDSEYLRMEVRQVLREELRSAGNPAFS